MLPSIMLPYVVLLALALLLFSTRSSLCASIMQTVFDNNGLYLLLSVVGYGVIAFLLNAIGFNVSLCKRWDALSLAKTAMIAKWIQVPAYLIIFVLGLILALNPLTFLLVVILFLLDCLTLFLSALPAVAATINAVRQGAFSLKETLWAMLLQAVFCADIVAVTIFYFKFKKRKAETQPT